MIASPRLTRSLPSFDAPLFETYPKADLPADAFERGPARAGDAPLAAGEARALPGKTRLEGTSFEPRSAVWLTDADGALNVVVSDEADLADQLRQNKRGPLVHRFFMHAAPGHAGRLGMFQFPQDAGDNFFRAQVYVPGKLTLDFSACNDVTLQGRYHGRSLNDPSGGQFAGEFKATRLDLSSEPLHAAEIGQLCAYGQPRTESSFTKTLCSDFVSVSRTSASITQAISGMQVGPAARDASAPAAGLGFFAAQHALNALGWQALARVCAFYGIDSSAVSPPSADKLAGKWLWTKTRALRKAREQVTALIAQRHGVQHASVHFDDVKGLGHAYRELYVAVRNEVSETRWMIPGIWKRALTKGTGETLYLPIIAEYQKNGTTVDSLAGEAPTLAQRGHKFFSREGAGKFSPRAAAPDDATTEVRRVRHVFGLGTLRG